MIVCFSNNQKQRKCKFTEIKKHTIFGVEETFSTLSAETKVIPVIKENYNIEELIQNYKEQLEKKAKTLACSFISDSFLLSMSNKEKQLKEILKKNKIIKKDSEADKAIPNFVSALCYSKIRPETANEILIHVSEGKTDLPNRENYKYLFEINSKVDYKSIKKYMDEMNQIMKDIEEEEQSLHEKRKDDPDLDKNIKNLEKKMVRNKHYMENNEEKDKKEEKKNRKKRKEKQKEEIIKEKKEEKNEHKIPRRCT